MQNPIEKMHYLSVLVVFVLSVSSLQAQGLKPQIISGNSGWNDAVSAFVQPYLYRVEVDYVLVKNDNNQIFGRNGESFYTRTPTWAYAAGERLWMSKTLLRSPWSIDPDFAEYADNADYHPDADSIFIHAHDGTTFALATEGLDALEYENAVGIRWADLPDHFFASGLLRDEKNCLAIILDEPDPAETDFEATTRWIKLRSVTENGLPDVSPDNDSLASSPRLFVNVTPSSSGLAIKIVGMYLGSKSVTHFIYPEKPVDSPASSDAPAPEIQEGAAPDQPPPAATAAPSSALTPTNESPAGGDAVEESEPTETASSGIPGLEKPTKEEKKGKKSKKKKGNNKDDN